MKGQPLSVLVTVAAALASGTKRGCLVLFRNCCAVSSGSLPVLSGFSSPSPRTVFLSFPAPHPYHKSIQFRDNPPGPPGRDSSVAQLRRQAFRPDSQQRGHLGSM